MASNLSATKDRLFELGVSSSTPGLAGLERAAELQRRLALAELADGSNGASVEGLSMSEMRARLSGLGESTATPGLVGDERRAALLRRLVLALRASDRAVVIAEGDAVATEKPAHAPPSPLTPPSPSPSPSLPPLPSGADPLSPPPPLAPPVSDPYADLPLGELRRLLKSVQTRRALALGSLMQGPLQDARLRDAQRLLTKVGTEQARLKELRRSSQFGCSALVSGGAMMGVEALLELVEGLRGEARERVRAARQGVRDECDGSAEFGLLVEARVEAALGRAAELGGRARQRVLPVATRALSAEAEDVGAGAVEAVAERAGAALEESASAGGSASDVLEALACAGARTLTAVGSAGRVSAAEIRAAIDGEAPATMGRALLVEEEEEEEEEEEDEEQVRALRNHGAVLEDLDDLASAEAVYLRALDMNPLDIRTLRRLAVFLHRRRGELARAESFFRRALQVSVPALLAHEDPRPPRQEQGGGGGGGPPHREGALSVGSVVRLLLSYAAFLQRARGDLEGAERVLRRAVEMAPADGRALSRLAHLLAEEGGPFLEADALFGRALRACAGDAHVSLWYAAFLRKAGKLAEAEVMFLSTIQNSASCPSIEPTAICNYATFLFRQKRDAAHARRVFLLGLQRFPQHKGLRRNYACVLRESPPPQGPDLSGV